MGVIGASKAIKNTPGRDTVNVTVLFSKAKWLI